ncbi:MAG TPA: GxxExxY protein [Gemmatimonas sp.]|nr:GxxExxY protein [Gemmatimonas sp.]
MPVLHEALTHAIIGAFYRVYNTLGYGFLESVYASAMHVELRRLELSFACERAFPVLYRSHTIAVAKLDLVVADAVVVELKAVQQIAGAHEAQLLNYLRASGMQVGLILNFGPKCTMRRMVWTGQRGSIDEGERLSAAAD